MLYVNEKVAKLGGIYLGGQVSSVEIQEAATIYVAQDDKGKVKQTQPVGYENAKIIIDIILEDSPEKTAIDQLTEMERLFRAPGQDRAKLFAIVNEDCAARGISEVYFKSLTSKQVVSESKRIASLELWAPKAAGIKVVKTAGSTQKSSVKTTENTGIKTTGKPGLDTLTISSVTGVINGATTQKTAASPAQDSRITSGAVKAVSNVIKAVTGRLQGGG